MLRPRRWTWIPGLALLLAGTQAHAKVDDRGRPWARGTLVPGLSFAASFAPPYLTTIGFGVFGGYYVANGLELGLSIHNMFIVWGPQHRADFPGIEKQLPTYIFRATPMVRFVFWRSRWFSPYMRAGLGPVVANHGGHVLGEWIAGPGAYIGLGPRVFLDLGVMFSMMFPASKCRDAFTFTVQGRPPANVEVRGPCEFTWSPMLGLVFAF